MYIVYKNCLQICPAVLYSNAGSILYAEFPRIGCKQEGSQIGNNKQNCHMRQMTIWPQFESVFEFRLLKIFNVYVENEPKFWKGLLFWQSRVKIRSVKNFCSCTDFESFFRASSWEKRIQKMVQLEKFWPYLFCDGFRTLMDQQTIRAFESSIINCVLTTSYRHKRRSIFYQCYLVVPQVLSLKELKVKWTLFSVRLG